MKSKQTVLYNLSNVGIGVTVAPPPPPRALKGKDIQMYGQVRNVKGGGVLLGLNHARVCVSKMYFFGFN